MNGVGPNYNKGVLDPLEQENEAKRLDILRMLLLTQRLREQREARERGEQIPYPAPLVTPPGGVAKVTPPAPSIPPALTSPPPAETGQLPPAPEGSTGIIRFGAGFAEPGTFVMGKPAPEQFAPIFRYNPAAQGGRGTEFMPAAPAPPQGQPTSAPSGENLAMIVSNPLAAMSKLELHMGQLGMAPDQRIRLRSALGNILASYGGLDQGTAMLYTLKGISPDVAQAMSQQEMFQSREERLRQGAGQPETTVSPTTGYLNAKIEEAIRQKKKAVRILWPNGETTFQGLDRTGLLGVLGTKKGTATKAETGGLKEEQIATIDLRRTQVPVQTQGNQSAPSPMVQPPSAAQRVGSTALQELGRR